MSSLKRKTPLKRSSTPLKRTGGLRKSSLARSKKTKKEQEEEQALKIKDHIFYQGIWHTRPHKCFETGEPLGWEPRTYYFHHVLEKESYPQYRHCTWNIVLVSWTTHDQVHGDIDKTPKIKALREELLKQIENGKHLS